MRNCLNTILLFLVLVTAFCVSGAPSVVAQSLLASEATSFSEQAEDESDDSSADVLALSRGVRSRAICPDAIQSASTFAWIVQPAFSHKEFRNARTPRPMRPVAVVGDTVSAPLLI